jgi:YVTN family beta-propeller protein
VFGVAASPRTGSIYITGDSGKVLVISGKTSKVTGTVTVRLPAEGGLAGVAVSPLTGNVYIAVQGAAGGQRIERTRGFVAVVSGKTGKVTATIPVGYNPVAVAVSPRSGDVYVTNSISGTVTVISGRTNKVIASIPVNGCYWVAVSPRTGKVYISDTIDSTRQSGAVSVISPVTNKVTAAVRIGDAAQAVAVSPRTGDIYVTNAGSNTVSVIAG